MKAIFTSLMVASVLVLSAFTKQSNIDGVIGAIRSGNSTGLSKYFDENVELTLPDKSDSYSKAQAEFVFRDFFRQHPPAEFSIIHQGSSKGGQPFAIGQYKSGTETYRVFMKIKVNNNQQLLHEISFSKE